MRKQNVQAKKIYKVFVFSFKVMINVFAMRSSPLLREVLPRLAGVQIYAMHRFCCNERAAHEQTVHPRRAE